MFDLKVIRTLQGDGIIAHKKLKEAFTVTISVHSFILLE